MKIQLSCLLLLLCLGCGTGKIEQASQTDSLTSITTTDTVPVPVLQPTQPADSTIKVLTLQWQNVSMSEDGAAYEFIDTKGTPLSFSIINIPYFDFQNNQYFEAKYAESVQFPTIKMLASGVWYHVTIKDELREENGVEGTYSVITNLKPIAN